MNESDEKLRGMKMSDKILDKYLEMREKASAMLFTEKESEGNQLFKEALEFREKNFTLDDWKKLLGKSPNCQEKVFLKKKIDSMK